jgi:hypothetical protein
VGWLLGPLGLVFSQALRGRRAQLGLDQDTAARAVRELRRALGKLGPLTRGEIVEQLAAREIRLVGQASSAMAPPRAESPHMC